jgi:RsiW-degrading membrane proteinase PrsW (M82 family)
MTPRLKRAMAIAGLLLALPGLLATFAFLCTTLWWTVDGGGSDAIRLGLVTFTPMMVTAGAGMSVAWHSLRSLQGKTSKPLRLPPAWALAGIFGLFVAVGLFILENDFAAGLFFPPVLLVAAALPPLLAIAWFTRQQVEGLTWRRGLVAFAGGATASVLIVIVLEILLIAIILALVFNLANTAMKSLEALIDALAGEDIAWAITSPGFIYVFIQMALIAPLAEEFAKPLVTLPLIGRLSRRDAFLVGAMAGAGFAALENVFYASAGLSFWAGILIVRALGGAIHPLGSGLVALGWHDILRGEPNAGLKWLARFGLASGIHALWNGGSLLVITLAGAQFFGQLPREIDVLELSAAGTTLALLIVLGLAALGIGRSIAQNMEVPGAPSGTESVDVEFTLSDRSVAIWALACLAAIVPAGIAGLQLLIRGI